MRRLLILFIVIPLLLVSLAGTIGCQQQPEPAPPAPAPTPELPIPANFSTYIEKGMFSISYPPDWELALSEIEGRKQFVEEYFRREGSTTASYQIVFFGGVPYQEDYNPTVGITVISLPEGEWSLEYIVEEIVRKGMLKYVEEYQEFSRTMTVIDGREVIILDFETKYPLAEKVHSLQMILHADNFLWTVHCNVAPPKEFSDFETDFHAIIRSLRILK
ncbi:hypothetical protein ACFLTP_09070 [Chloroflexota bacterium]